MELLIQAVIGLLAGLLGGLLGIGGSVVIIPALILHLSHTNRGYSGDLQHLLQAAAMICNVFVAAPSVLAHYRARAIVGRVVVLLIPAALLGILLGVWTSNGSSFARQNGAYLAMILAGFLVYVAAYNTWSVFGRTEPPRQLEEKQSLPRWKVATVGILMGFAAGLLGIGGGAICVPTQQILLRLPLRNAIANSAATIMCVSSIGAVYKNVTLPAHGVAISASLQLALMLIPTAILGGYLGGKLTHILPRTMLRLVFVVFMLTVAYLIFSEARLAGSSDRTLGQACPAQAQLLGSSGSSRPAGSLQMPIKKGDLL